MAHRTQVHEERRRQHQRLHVYGLIKGGGGGIFFFNHVVCLRSEEIGLARHNQRHRAGGGAFGFRLMCDVSARDGGSVTVSPPDFARAFFVVFC